MAASDRPGARALHILALVTAFVACSDPAIGPPPEPPDPGGPGPDSPLVYRVEPPDGRLPWPHHDPDWDQARYDSMLADLWVINNFGQYQGSPDASVLYLHDALDVVIPNGTPVRAVTAGRVVAEIGGSEHYRTLIVEDEDHPGYGWGYTHIYYFRVQPGDSVNQGTVLGQIHPVTPSGQAERTLTLYQMYGSVNPPAPEPGHYNARFGYYMITNSDGREPDVARVLDPAERRHAWRTAETDATGSRRYPDGECRVTVTAFDSGGNSSRRTETVRVRN